MLVFLGAFAALPLLLPWLVSRVGARAFYVAAALPLLAFVHAVALAPALFAGDIPLEEYRWIPAIDVSLSMRMDVLGWLLTLVVTGVGALVMIYCRWYFRGKTEGVGQFSAVLLAFAGAMYGLVLTDDVVVLIMLWEITSVLSYLLIGYYHARSASRRAALQALLVTTLGGLVMLIGVVLLVVQAGTSSLSTILADPPTGTVTDIAVLLLLVGALSKSAIFPFHFWLPGAMAAPTPVSAYLHAAAMVKAGIYLVARLAPGFAETPFWRPTLITLGVFTMLLGGFQALRERDLKRILAFGTVSQLGFLTVMLGYGTRDAALAGVALLLAHALFKSCLFLVVGVIDRQLNTRDIGQLSGLARQAPVMATTSFVAIASMAGVIPTLGFVAKETALTALLHEAEAGAGWGIVALVGIVLGSALTAAYGIRFLWGAYGTKRDVETTEWPDPPIGFLSAPVLLAAASLALGLLSPIVDHWLAPYADGVPAATPGVRPPDEPYHLALWHGLEPALFISLGTLALGAGLFWVVRKTQLHKRRRVLPFTANDAYNLTLRSIDHSSEWVTARFQRGSLPFYVGTIFIVLVVAEGTALFASREWRAQLDGWQSPAQLLAAPLMIAAGILAVRARKRYTGVALVSVTGLGLVVLFATSGAPDLALTQVLIETVTLVVFALVLRRLPARMGEQNASVAPLARAVLGAGVGLVMALVAVVATGARQDVPVSLEWPPLSYEIGHGRNVVNVALVDLRGWDTMGELSVLVLAATGVASLVFITDRSDNLARRSGTARSRTGIGRRRPLIETDSGVRARRPGETDAPRAWLISGSKVQPENRSILLEIIVRVLFHSIMIVSLYLLFAGHNLPGGGFAGGLVAGMGLVMRYIAGGRWELGAAAPTDAGRLLGAGMAIAVLCALLPMVFGFAPLQSFTFEGDLPLIGHWEFVTSTIFDVGVYLVVIGLVLDVLRSLGAEVDRQSQHPEDAEMAPA